MPLTRRLIMALTCLLLLETFTVQAQTPTSLSIVSVDQSQAPTLTIAVRATNADGSTIRPSPPYTVTAENQPVAVEARVSRLPAALAFVTDLSSSMNAQGTNGSRFDDMVPLMRQLLSLVQGRGEQLASLTIIRSQLVHPHTLTNDLGAIGNTFNNANQQLLGFPFTPEADTTAQAYPINDAIMTALDDLDRAPQGTPRTLALFVANNAQQTLDEVAITKRFETARAAGNPISLLVVGFGAESGAVQRLATKLNGQILQVGTQRLDPAARKQIEDRFFAIAQLDLIDVLHLNTTDLPPGNVTLTIAANGAQAQTTVQVSDTESHVTVVTDKPVFQGNIRLTTATDSTQQSISQVTYLLGNRILNTTPLTNNPDFVFEIDTSDPAFQQRFPPGEYPLMVAARDAQGGEIRSEAIPITLVAAPPTLLAQIGQFWWVGGLLGILLIGSALVLMIRRPKQPAAGLPPSLDKANTPTQRYDQEDVTTAYRPQDEATQRFGTEPTMAYPQVNPTQLLIHWKVIIMNNNSIEHVDLSNMGGRHFDIGRPTTTHRPHISINNALVSRQHAKLEYIRDELELVIENETENGTFFGEGHERRLVAGERIKLTSGDVFWVSLQVKLQVVSDI